MKKIDSRDGTPIAFDRVGQGPPVVIVVGAFNDRGTGASLAEALKPEFTAYTYDRRGRGDSGDTKPYAVERELEDLGAVIAEAGGSACVFGYSSGGVLALDGAARALPMTKLAVYEVPLKADGPLWAVDHAAELARLVEAGRRGDAVEYFQAKVIGIPEGVVAQLRGAPFRPALEAMADTLVYEALIVGDGRCRSNSSDPSASRLSRSPVSRASPSCGRRQTRSPGPFRTGAPWRSRVRRTTSTRSSWGHSWPSSSKETEAFTTQRRRSADDHEAGPSLFRDHCP
ncbi:MAG: alpha/beta fold hydrolase [Candidatus Limnocylindria bacterium]